eukprot:TRINITY_DN19617_c0_g1_i2.p1 TRINITY_DN19617_c0_g1~~TRINITY_DN19617_c0_g1_i2.p1  ORF type:complete len:266 (+),score=12.95 TRINITY_DN19617_c0_g1_i2:39-836(+)
MQGTSNNAGNQNSQPPSANPGQVTSGAQSPLTNLIPVSQSGLQVLESLHGIYLKQKMDKFEALIPYEIPNRYNLFPLDLDGNPTDQRLFKIKEKSAECQRHCFRQRRAFKLTVKLMNDHTEVMDFLKLERPGVCCKCDKGEMKISLLEGGEKVVGFVNAPFTCCKVEILVNDANHKLRFVIKAECLQPGLICFGCPFGSCREISFTIYDTGSKPLGKLRRKTSFVQSCLTDSDDFTLNFPLKISLDDKILLLGAILMLDFAYLER